MFEHVFYVIISYADCASLIAFGYYVYRLLGRVHLLGLVWTNFHESVSDGNIRMKNETEDSCGVHSDPTLRISEFVHVF